MSLGRFDLQRMITTMVMRSDRAVSVVVEGSTDHNVVKAALNKAELESNETMKDIIIDSIEEQVALKEGRGNGDIVEECIKRIMILNDDLPVFGLRDRKYDGRGVNCSINGAGLMKSRNLYITHGHSIENYAFDSEYYELCLNQIFPRFVDPNIIRSINRNIDTIMQIFFEIPTLAKNNSLISKMSALLDTDCFTLDENGDISGANHSRLFAKLNSRGSNLSSTDAEVELRSMAQSRPDMAELLLSIHGHIGFEGSWAGIGKLLTHFNVDQTALNHISRGFNREKWNVFSSYFAGRNKHAPFLHPLIEKVLLAAI